MTQVSRVRILRVCPFNKITTFLSWNVLQSILLLQLHESTNEYYGVDTDYRCTCLDDVCDTISFQKTSFVRLRLFQ